MVSINSNAINKKAAVFPQRLSCFHPTHSKVALSRPVFLSCKNIEFFNWFFAEESPHSEELRKSGTMDLIALEGAIIKNWQYLCDDVRNRIKEVYVQVNFDDPENPILSRFPPE